jgi:general secretion pathway protein L
MLIVWISNQENAKASWWVWSEQDQNIIESGILLTWQSLGSLPQSVLSLPLVVLVDGSDLFLKQIELPKGSGRHLDKMLPFLVEDDIAQEVTALHFTVVSKQGNKALVAGMERVWLEQLCQLCRDIGATLTQVIPDVLALPETDDVTLMRWQQKWLVRELKPASAYVIDAAWLNTLVQHRWQHQPSITAFAADPILDTPDGWQHQSIESAEALLSRGIVQSNVTLLSGVFKLNRGAVAQWNIWRNTLVAGVLLLLLCGAQRMISANQWEQERTAIRAESERIFRVVFPDKQRIPTMSYLMRELEDESARLSGGNRDNGILVVLDQLSAQLASLNGVQLNRLSYEDSRAMIRIDLQSADFQGFEQAKNSLSTQFVVESGPLSRRGDLVLGSLTLKRGQ